ncbi:MAG: hypothetical protein LBE36_04520 [Flavobacteriaceae bacterium]|jgi:antitoxin component of RelBE/YafQ-DinJ toxin-antitoxin module|nr:hypothetical protein [Flavobacteriaceae bacterium]
MRDFLVYTKTEQEAVFFAELLNKLNVPYDSKLRNNTVKTNKKRIKIPNKRTIEAIEELESGNGVKFETVSDLFKSIN